jgi:hypothetical protein
VQNWRQTIAQGETENTSCKQVSVDENFTQDILVKVEKQHFYGQRIGVFAGVIRDLTAEQVSNTYFSLHFLTSRK